MDAPSSEERRTAMQDIFELFLSAGYHRARFTDVAVFDKLLGCFVWAILNSSDGDELHGLDLSALSEESSLGEKIATCERVERALREMGCPHELRAHQVRGLDADAATPVARWLVRRVIERRELRGDRVRKFSRFVYRRIDRLDSLEVGASARTRATQAGRLRDDFGARRAFRRARGTAPPRENPARWAKSVMMEYGHKLAGLEAFASAATAVLAASRWKRKTKASKAAGTLRAGKTDGEKSEKSEGITALVNKVSALNFAARGGEGEHDDLDEDDEAAASELSALQNLESELAVDDGSDTLSSAVARAILGAKGGKEILEAAEKFSGDLDVGGVVGEMLAVERKIAATERKLAAELEAANEARERMDAAQAEVTTALEKLEEVNSYNEKCENETKKLDEAVTNPEQREAVTRLKELIKRASSLKAEEKAFKAECKKRMLELKEEVERGGEHTLTEEERAQIEEVEATHAREREKFEGERAMLSKRARAVALLSRKLEDIPTRPELIQYERRFEELYDTVQAKLKETRKYFAAYNVLADTKKYLNKEISLLNSIHQQVQPALETVKGKSSLVDALSSIEDGVRQNISLVEEKLAAEREAADAAREAVDDATRAQRQHAALVRDLRDAAKRESDLRKALASA